MPDTGKCRYFIPERCAFIVPRNIINSHQVFFIETRISGFHKTQLPLHDKHSNQHNYRNRKLKNYKKPARPLLCTDLSFKEISFQRICCIQAGDKPGWIQSG
jgi:hypothetical protein